MQGRRADKTCPDCGHTWEMHGKQKGCTYSIKLQIATYQCICPETGK